MPVANSRMLKKCLMSKVGIKLFAGSQVLQVTDSVAGSMFKVPDSVRRSEPATCNLQTELETCQLVNLYSLKSLSFHREFSVHVDLSPR